MSSRGGGFWLCDNWEGRGGLMLFMLYLGNPRCRGGRRCSHCAAAVYKQLPVCPKLSLISLWSANTLRNSLGKLLKATITCRDNPEDKTQFQELLPHGLFLVFPVVFPPVSVFGQSNPRHLNFTTFHVYIHSLHPLTLSNFLWQKDGQMGVRPWDSRSCYKLFQVHWGNCILASVGWCNACSGWMTWVFSLGFFLIFFLIST